MNDTRIRKLMYEEFRGQMQRSHQGKDGKSDTHVDGTSQKLAYTLLSLLPMITKAYVSRV